VTGVQTCALPIFQIRELIDELPPEYREVLLLKHDQGRSYRDIARLLGMTAKGVESRLFRARQTLAGKLKRLDGDGQENR
jgi:RNA polymerase sigma-70 factor (ECF subfamily)